MKRIRQFLHAQRFALILITSILVGSLAGYLFKKNVAVVKPVGDIFLNALFTAVVPLVFFSISSAVAGMAGSIRLFKILFWMLTVFAATGVLAAILMLVAVQAYPPAQGVDLPVPEKVSMEHASTGDQIVSAVTVPDFINLLSKKNMLAMIVFAVLVGLATSAAGERGKAFADFLHAGNEVFMKIISYIMLAAPVGLAACFANLVGAFGPDLLKSYLRAMVLYYPICIAYFFIAFTLYAYMAGRARGVKSFWSNIPPAALTAAATGSSFATIPLNLEAANKVGVPKDISEVVIPIGATIHMDGSVLAALLKIAFLFGIYHMPFTGIETFASAIGISLLSGMVMSGIPGGGFTGEILIVTLYGFPPEALPIISMIGTVVDSPATMVNSVGDNVASMMIARIMGGRNWMDRKLHSSRQAAPQVEELVEV